MSNETRLLRKQNKILRRCLKAIRDYKSNEICKDDFAYDRMVEAYQDAAKAGLKEAKETKVSG